MAKIEKSAKVAKVKTRRRLPADVERALRAADAKQASDIVALDLREAAGFTDFFVICSGRSAPQIRAIADAVMDALREKGTRPAHVEGYDRSEWILIDYFDFVVHVFLPETRHFYSLERLWGDAEPVPFSTP